MDCSQADMALSRKVRIKELIDDVARIDENITKQSDWETLRFLRHVNEKSDDIIAEGQVKDRTEHTTEVVMDAQLMKMSHVLLSKVLEQNSTFNTHMYQMSILNMISVDDDVKWENIMSIACGLAATVRAKPSMLGTIDAEIVATAAKRRQKRRRASSGEEQRPHTVDNLRRKDKGAQKVNIIQKQVAEILKANNRQPLPFFKIIIDPNNFMNTVENAFQLAFLARDNYIGITTGADGYPQVHLTTRDERNEEAIAKQAICTLDMQLCQKMTEFYKITEPMLKMLEMDQQINPNSDESE